MRPRGAIATPRHVLGASMPYRPSGSAPAQFNVMSRLLAFINQIG